MATYSPTTSTAREAELVAHLPEINAERAAKTPPQGAITKDQLVQGILNDVIDSWIDTRVERDEAATLALLRQAYKNATPSQRATARAAIGLP